MAENRQPGKLAVILHADVAGSTRLVQQNEHVAHERIQETFHRFGDIITKHHGRVRELRGDALLAEFERASSAVSASLEFQFEQDQYIQGLEDAIKPEVRVGVAMGEVVIADNTITGEGVVLAQRLEQLAEPGGMVIQAAARETIPSRFPFGYSDLGEQELKGFDESVRAYMVHLEEGFELPEPEVISGPTKSSIMKNMIAAGVVALLIGGGVLAWLQPWEVREEPASLDRMAYPLPEKPSIAVLPFDSLSSEKEQEYFADGLTSDIITDLSKFGDLMVIAAHSTLPYKGKTVSIHQVAEELGVRYVVDGTIQKSDNQVRISARFIDAITGEHLWAERYARELSDVFQVQDEITRKIVSTIGGWSGQLTEADFERATRKSTTDLTAYENFLIGMELGQRFTKEDNSKAREFFEKAILHDPGYSRAYATLAWTHYFDWLSGWSESAEQSGQDAYKYAMKAVEMDDSEAEAHWVLAKVYGQIRKQPEEAVAGFERALALNPNHPDILAGWGGYDMPVLTGRADEGIELVKRAMRFNPSYPNWYEEGLGLAAYVAKRYDEADSAFSNVKHHTLLSRATFAANYAMLGRQQEAHSEIAKILELDPRFSIGDIVDKLYFASLSDLEHYVDGLRKAGVPEYPPPILPDKPSIAVLPFSNMSGDEQQNYFVDGVTEDIITILSRFSELFVIAKRSSFRYRDQDTEITQIGEELGVQYLVEGSIRRNEDELIINVQLVDTAAGTNVWTERYQVPLTGFFEVQQDILDNIVSTVAGRIENVELRLAGQKGTDNLSAYDLVLQGYAQFPKWTRESFELAREFFQDAIELDPQYARAYAGIGFTHNIAFSRNWGEDPQGSLEKAREMALKAIELDDQDNRPRVVLGWAYINAGELDKGVGEIKKGISLNPNDADVLARSGYALTYYGEFQQAIDQVKRAMRINPFHPTYYYDVLAWAQYFLNQYDDALVTLENISKPNMAHLLTLAAASARIGDSDKAQQYVREILDKEPNFNLAQYRETRPFKYPEHIDFHVESLRMAGLP